MSYETLVVERRGAVGWLRFNRPDALNAHDLTMLAELPDAWEELDDDESVVVIVMTGNGRAFCTGADVKEIAAAGGGMRERLAKGGKRRRRRGIGPRANDVWKPVIAAVNGVCAGGGLHFICEADLVIAAESATFVDTHVSVGQVAALEPIGLLGRIPFAVMELALLGRHQRMSAQRAADVGMVNRVVPLEELEDAAQQLAETVARNSPSALMASKRAIWNALELPRANALAHGMDILSTFWAHPDNAEGPPRLRRRERDPVWAAPTRTFQ